MTLLPAAALARDNVVPANPMTRDAVQVPLSFISYEHRTDHTEYAAGAGYNLNSWLLGAALRYHVSDPWQNELLRARGPADALELEVVVGNGGTLFSELKLSDLCAQEGLKPDDCFLSNLDVEKQELYSERGPAWDAPLIALLLMGGSWQQLTLRAPADRSVEQGQSMWGARARLLLGGYLGRILFGGSVGAATLGAPPAQVSYCTPLVPTGASAEFTCTPAYLESYNRTTIVDARLEWRQAIHWIGFNPALQAVFQRSQRDDPATTNDDTRFGLRTIDLEIPVYFYVHSHADPGFYTGLRGMLRWWNVDRPQRVEALGGFFLSMAYGGAEHGRHRIREKIEE